MKADRERLMEVFYQLCKVPSISGSSAEAAMAERLAEIIGRIPYFRANPANLRIYDVPGHPAGAKFIFALLEAEEKCVETVVLLSHFDVVGVDEYGAARELAFDPRALTNSLQEGGGFSLPEEAKADLESGDYIFGRGTMDMKFGIAAGIEVLWQKSADPAALTGNILFVSVPDEEANSAGMLAAVPRLLALKEEKGLEYKCCLVSEPFMPKYPGDNNSYIYTGGAVGKLLPVFYCVGRETHVCQPYSGLNPNLLTAAILEEIEQNPDLADEYRGERATAPICLKQTDTKDEYSVQTPTAAYAYFSYMTLAATPQTVLAQMKGIAARAFTSVLADFERKLARWQEISGSEFSPAPISPKVLSYQELYRLCLDSHGEEFASHIREFAANSPLTDQRLLSVELVREVHSFCPDRDPMIIVFFAPPFYPHTSEDEGEGIVYNVSRKLVELARSQFNEDMQLVPFFPGLSDMSYLNLDKRLDIDSLAENFPLWGSRYSVPLAEIDRLSLPFINLGPRGKDPHKLTERLNLTYSLAVTLPLTLQAVDLVLAENE